MCIVHVRINGESLALLLPQIGSKNVATVYFWLMEIQFWINRLYPLSWGAYILHKKCIYVIPLEFKPWLRFSQQIQEEMSKSVGNLNV